MKGKNILIPGAGGFAAVNVIKSLRKSNVFSFSLVTTDANPLSVGFHLADKGYVLPKISDKNFLEEAIALIKKEKIDIILPTSGFDIIVYSKHKKEIEKLGVTCFFSDYDVINLCNNKIKFYEATKLAGFKVPKYTDDIKKIDFFPIFAKPIQGKGSRDTFLINSIKDLEYINEKYQDMIYSEYLPGIEYTIDVLSDLDGNAILAVPRERIETKEGISFKGKVVNNVAIEEEAKKLAQFLNIKGPCCIQMKEDINGKLRLVEVNPRMGGGTIMAKYAGVNIPELILKLESNIEISENEINFNSVTVLRYYEEIVIKNKKKI